MSSVVLNPFFEMIFYSFFIAYLGTADEIHVCDCKVRLVVRLQSESRGEIAE